MQNDDKKLGLEFLKALYGNLHMKEEVMHRSDNIQKPIYKIETYIDALERTHTQANSDRLKRLYYDKYVTKESEIKESYFELQKKIYLERGYGHIKLTDKDRQQMREDVIKNQKDSLDVWLDYFLSEESNYIPMWCKYWMFQGMIKLGKYDKEKREFSNRTKDTVLPFADLNREALGLVVDYLIKYLKQQKNKSEDKLITDKEILEVLNKRSFSSIYSYVMTELLNNSKQKGTDIDGEWILYKQGSNPSILVESLKGYGTAWCIANDTTAENYLKQGDISIYYSKDENEEYKIPRACIRKNGKLIAEVRGVADAHQNLESEMIEIVDKKLDEYPDKEEYKKKVRDMNLLTEIYNENKINSELNINDLRFLYEIDNKIEGFGYKNDPRIKEILSNRDKKEDLAKILNCSIEQISLTEEEAIEGDKIYHYGNLDLRDLRSGDGIKLPTIVSGYLDLSGLTSAKGLTLPNKVGGDLDLHFLASTEGLILPDEIGGQLDLTNLTNAEGLIFPENLEYLNLRSIESAKGLRLPKKIMETLNLSGLTSTEGLLLPDEIGSLYLTSLTSAEGLVLPREMRGCLGIGGLKSAKDLKLPNKVMGILDLSGLTSAEGLLLPEEVDYLNIINLIDFEGLILPNKMNGIIRVNESINPKGRVSFSEFVAYVENVKKKGKNKQVIYEK